MMYATRTDIQGGMTDLTTQSVVDRLDAICSETWRTVDADLSAYLNIAKLHAASPVPAIVWLMTVQKGRELAYATYYGGAIPEDGGQVKYWREEYQKSLDRVRAGDFMAQLSPYVANDGRYGTMEAI